MPATTQSDLKTRRRNPVKLIAWSVVLFVEVGILCRYGGYLAGRRSATRAVLASRAARASTYKAAREREIAAGEQERVRILKVDFIRYVDPQLANDPWAQIEFRVTNQSGKAINDVGGRLRLYGPEHRSLGLLVGANITEPLAVGGSALRRTRWDQMVFYPEIRAAIVRGDVTAEYSADHVLYADGSSQRFGEPWPDGALFSEPASGGR